MALFVCLSVCLPAYLPGFLVLCFPPLSSRGLLEPSPWQLDLQRATRLQMFHKLISGYDSLGWNRGRSTTTCHLESATSGKHSIPPTMPRQVCPASMVTGSMWPDGSQLCGGRSCESPIIACPALSTLSLLYLAPCHHGPGGRQITALGRKKEQIQNWPCEMFLPKDPC